MRENKKERERVLLRRRVRKESERAVFEGMKAYSQDLRQRIVRAVEQGTPRSDVASLFSVSPSTIKRYLRQKREKGDIQPKRIPGRPPIKRAALQATLRAQLEAYPDATLQEHCEMWK